MTNMSTKTPDQVAASAYSHRPATRNRLQQLRAENGAAAAAVGENKKKKKQPMECVPEDINECAEDFIKRFRQNLLLQRLQSIENYKQMLARGL